MLRPPLQKQRGRRVVDMQVSSASLSVLRSGKVQEAQVACGKRAPREEVPVKRGVANNGTKNHKIRTDTGIGHSFSPNRTSRLPRNFLIDLTAQDYHFNKKMLKQHEKRTKTRCA